MSSIEVRATSSTVTGHNVRTSNSRPPSGQLARPRPRPRPVLSCLRCRRRKIKCDRSIPRKQCMLTGHDGQCTYNAEPKAGGVPRPQSFNGRQSTTSSANNLVTDAVNLNGSTSIPIGTESQAGIKTETLFDIQRRLQTLEQLCASRSYTPIRTSERENNEKKSNEPLPKADAALSIKPSGARYHSQTYKKSLFHHFNIVSRFIHSGFDDPETGPVLNELRRYHELRFKARRKPEKPKVDNSSSKPFTLLELLPSQDICDGAVKSYFESFEKCMRILHRPSFADECQQFWAFRESQRQEFQYFVPQLAAIVGIIQFWDATSSAGEESEKNATILCDYVQEWLDSLIGRKQLTLAALQARALLIVAQQVRGVQADEIWKATGILLRSAMVAGLHRDPSEFPDIQAFEGELRRRLWMTILEMDLQASLVYGMPIMLRASDFTCKVPSNVDDLVLADGMTEIPLSKSLNESSDSVFQVALAKSLSLRLQAISESSSQREDTSACLYALERYIQDLPSYLKPGRQDSGRTSATIELHIYIRRILSSLYRSSIPFEMTPESLSTGIQSSLAILFHQKVFDPEFSGSDDGQREKHWDLFHVLFKSDLMQAALDVCLYAQATDLVSWTRASLLLAIEETVGSLMRRISRRGSDIKDVLRLSVTFQLLKANIKGEDGEEMMKQGSYDVLLACRRANGQGVINIEEDGNRVHTRDPTSPNTRFTLENGGPSNDWDSLPDNPSMTSNDFTAYFGTNGANFDILSHFDFENTYGDLWSQF